LADRMKRCRSVTEFVSPAWHRNERELIGSPTVSYADGRWLGFLSYGALPRNDTSIAKDFIKLIGGLPACDTWNCVNSFAGWIAATGTILVSLLAIWFSIKDKILRIKSSFDAGLIPSTTEASLIFPY
jgi:hypothetical protein